MDNIKVRVGTNNTKVRVGTNNGIKVISANLADTVQVNSDYVVSNILYVTEDGNDSNTGKKLGEAKATISAAVGIATEGTVIKVSAGTYIENNPIVLPKQISIVGDNLREVTVVPQNSNADLFYVNNGNYISNMSFSGSLNSGKAVFAFNPTKPVYINQSPYVQNCTNFIPNSIGLKVDGSKAIGPTKSMVLDSYTQYNQNGIGASITNEGYAQLVSMFTICNDIAVYCSSGGGCDLTNSNSSFGNYALVADGISAKKYTGIVTVSASENSDTFVLDLNTPTLNVTNAVYDNVTGLTTITVNQNHNFSVGMGVSISNLTFTCPSGEGTAIFPSGNNGYVFDVINLPSSTSFEVYVGVSTIQHTYSSGGAVKINAVRPFDGQVVYFGQPYYTIGGVTVSAGGTGYTGNASVIFSSPESSWGISASAVAEVKNGSVVKVEMVSSGRGYGSTSPTVTFSSPDVGINTAIGVANLVPAYYTIQSSTPIVSGICTITLNDVVPFSVGVGTTTFFFKQSRVLASGHSLEYIGSGTNIASALPVTGGVAIQENEIDMRNGGLVVYTSTDQSGNFRIGEGVVINQQAGTISGTFYSKSLFSNITPYILALGGE